MRQSARSANGQFHARLVCGTRAMSVALDCPADRLDGLRGFAWHRRSAREPEGRWLESDGCLLHGAATAVHGLPEATRSTRDSPVQSFMLHDDDLEPGSVHVYRIHPMYGPVNALRFDEDDVVEMRVRSEDETIPEGRADEGSPTPIALWFNRAVIEATGFVRRFGDIEPSTQQLEDLSQPVMRWLSRGLVESCLSFIDDTPAHGALRIAVGAFHYKPLLNAVKAAIDRGVDVRISLDDGDANLRALRAAGIPKKHGRRRLVHPRREAGGPVGAFLVRLLDDQPVAAWSTTSELSAVALLGASQIAWCTQERALAERMLKHWTLLADDPAMHRLHQTLQRLSPLPDELPAEDSSQLVLMPRADDDLLKWLGRRVHDAGEMLLLLSSGETDEKRLLPVIEERGFLRFVMMEKRSTREQFDRLREERDLLLSLSAAFDELHSIRDGSRRAHRLFEYGLDRWFLREVRQRAGPPLHGLKHRMLLVDPLSEDPLVFVCAVPLNADAVIEQGDMALLARGDTRIADICLTEVDRLFRACHARVLASERRTKGMQAERGLLDESAQGALHWGREWFLDGHLKCRQRMLMLASNETGPASSTSGPVRSHSLAPPDRATEVAIQHITAAAAGPRGTPVP